MSPCDLCNVWTLYNFGWSWNVISLEKFIRPCQDPCVPWKIDIIQGFGSVEANLSDCNWWKVRNNVSDIEGNKMCRKMWTMKGP